LEILWLNSLAIHFRELEIIEVFKKYL